MEELSTERLRRADLPDTDSGEGLIEFAHTFDGYRHFGGTEPAVERMEAVRGAWEQDRTLCDEIDDLRACLFCEFRRERLVRARRRLLSLG